MRSIVNKINNIRIGSILYIVVLILNISYCRSEDLHLECKAKEINNTITVSIQVVNTDSISSYIIPLSEYTIHPYRYIWAGSDMLSLNITIFPANTNDRYFDENHYCYYRKNFSRFYDFESLDTLRINISFNKSPFLKINDSIDYKVHVTLPYATTEDWLRLSYIKPFNQKLTDDIDYIDSTVNKSVEINPQNPFYELFGFTNKSISENDHKILFLIFDNVLESECKLEK